MIETSVSDRFAGTTIIVTGAGSGIGRATALSVAASGGRVVACDVARDRLDTLRAECDGLEVSIVAGDIADPRCIDDILEKTDGRADGLANVAGIMDGFLPPIEVDDATWDRVFAVNVVGPMRLSRAVLPLMVAAGSGSIVNVASEAAFRASAAGAAYTASKRALVGLTESIAFFHGPQGIRANTVAPGPVATGIEAVMRSQAAASRVGPVMQATMPSVATAQDIAASITWLLSSESRNVNGTVLKSDGGWSVA